VTTEEYGAAVTDVAAGVVRVRERIAAAARRSGRRPEDVTLVAVTKGVDPDRIRAAIAAGLADLGESRVQEAALKIEAMGRPVRWHLVGHLQRNKAARAVALFDVIHSVDSAALLAELSARAEHQLDVLLQVNIAQEPQKHGVLADALPALVRDAAGLRRVRIAGLMTIAPQVPEPEQARAVFRRLRELRGELGRLLGAPMPHLSMGMTDDFEVAVEEGATLVRIGRAIFGARG
jgi:pyridoxal phosphate enzyme (YggS family)